MVYINGNVVAYSSGNVGYITSGGVTYYRANHKATYGSVLHYGVTYQSSSSYTGNFIGNFTGNFVGDYAGTTTVNTDYVGNYSRSVAYTRNSVDLQYLTHVIAHQH